MDTSYLIALAIPVFLFLILCEYLFGIFTGNNTYRLNDTFASISLGMISRFPPMLNLGFQGAIFAYAASHLNLTFMPTESWVTWTIAFVLYDLTYYWMHRLHHEIKVFWATHVVHHQGEEFNLSTALRQTSSGFLWKWIFFIPMFVLGIPAEVFVTVGALNLLYQFWVHTEHVPKLGIFETVFVTPSNHRVHHAQNQEYIDANYGGVFILWDRIFGTFIEEKADLSPVYGTVKPLHSWNPLWANIEIFHQMIRDTIYTKSVKDKVRVWFSDTSWRPVDAEKRFPKKINNLNNFKKYDPAISRNVKIYGLVQFFILNVIALVMFFTLDSQGYGETVLLGIVLVVSMTSVSMVFENVQGSSLIELVRAGLLLAIFFTGLVDSSLLVSQILVVHALMNIILVSILFPLRKIFLLAK